MVSIFSRPQYVDMIAGTTGVWLYYLFTDATLVLPASECLVWHYSAQSEPAELDQSALWDPCPCGSNYVSTPSNLLYKTHQIPNFKCFLSRLAFVFSRSIEARCYADNEDVVGAAPTGDAPTISE